MSYRRVMTKPSTNSSTSSHHVIRALASQGDDSMVRIFEVRIFEKEAVPEEGIHGVVRRLEDEGRGLSSANRARSWCSQ